MTAFSIYMHLAKMCCSFVCLYNNIVEMLIYIYVHQIKKQIYWITVL